jgi:hypothetical protein
MKMGSKGCGTKKYAKGGTKVSVKKVVKKPTKSTKKVGTKKYAAGGTSSCKKQSCPQDSYWREDLCRCVKILSFDSLLHPPSKADSMFGAFGEYSNAKKVKETTNRLFENVSKQKNKSKKGVYKTGGVVKSTTKKYAMGGFSQECDPGDGKKGKNCQTVKKEGVIKRWIRNAKNRNLSNFNKPKFKRTKY